MEHELRKTIAVNDVFLDNKLLENRNRLLVLYGGFGSGKSVFASQKVIHRITTEKGHRILVIRKTANTLRESVFKLLTNEIVSRDIRHEFIINKTNESFRHLPTGNEILCEGLDDPEKLKSIVDITSIWFEEPTELTQEEFDKAILRMRSQNQHYEQILLTFNPIDERHWLKKRFFDQEQRDCFVLHTTYKDNFFLSDEYRSTLEDLAIINPNLYRVGCLGEWGKADVQRPYVHNFSRDKHVNALAKRQDNRPIIISLDFNLDPFVCVMAHQWHDGRNEHLHFFKEIVIKNGDIQTMATRIKDSLTAIQLVNALFTGDATGRNRNISQQDAASNWKLLQRLLSISDNRLKLPRSNPSVSGSRNLINLVFATHPDLLFSSEMSLTINELLYTEADEEGNILKKDRSKMEQRADALDCFIGDTLIMTESGERKISEIKIGERVLTRKGFRAVIDKWDSYAEVYEFELSNGTKITCTKDHKFFVHNIGFCKIFDIFEERLNVCKFTEVKNTESTISSRISIAHNRGKVIQGRFTDKCGMIISERFQKVIISTIKTVIRQIMIYQTWKLLVHQLTPNFIGERTNRIRKLFSVFKNWLRREENLRKAGMEVRLESNGTKNTRRLLISVRGHSVFQIALIAESNMREWRQRQSFVPIIANQNGEEKIKQIMSSEFANGVGKDLNAINILKQPTAQSNAPLLQHTQLKVMSVKKVGLCRVFDITVEDQPEFYANGILAHNCVRYLIQNFYSDWERRMPFIGKK